MTQTDGAIEQPALPTVTPTAKARATVEPFAPTVEPPTDSTVDSAVTTLPPSLGDNVGEDAVWCLGIDVGTTTLSATLVDYQTGRTYPLVWQETEADGERLSNLPAIAYFSARQLQHAPEIPVALGYQALESALSATRQADTAGLLVNNIKPYLNVAVPYFTAHQVWEPMLQWSDQRSLALQWLQQAMVALLETLQGKATGLTIAAPTLAVATVHAAIANLSSVVIGYPTGWSDTYCFNLREAVLAAGLVDCAEQIYFLEESIATLLATLHQPVGPPSPPDTAALPRWTERSLPRDHWVGGTLVISAGATTTELLLADVPRDPTLLHREALYLRSFAYAGDAIDQDIICQILYPSAWHWDSLDLQNLALPLPGQPDQEARDRLQQRLRSSEVGCQLLNATRQLKLALHQEDAATFKLNQQQWTVSRHDLYSRVITPYLQQLNRELNVLLNQSGIAVQAIQHVICNGGTTTLPTIADWLKQKLPNARLFDKADSMAESRIANGLAMLPRYPQLLDTVRHQYSDYFLLHELVQSLPNEPLSVGRILQQLETQGINTAFCQRSILHLLEGHLPDGLLPSGLATSVFALNSQQNLDYQELTTTPLFSREGNQIYAFNPEQRDRLQHYLKAILVNTHQTLMEPLSIDLGVAARG